MVPARTFLKLAYLSFGTLFPFFAAGDFLTVTLHFRVLLETFALIVAVPFFTPFTRPLELTVAIFLLLLVQVTFAFVPLTLRVTVWFT